MSEPSAKESVALSSAFGGLCLTLMKLVVALMTGSIGILAEAFHSGMDFLSSVFTYLAVRLSDKPADKCHNYGHEKVEAVAALTQAYILGLTSLWIVYESVHRLMYGGEIEIAWYAFAVMIISIAVDFSRSRALRRVAKETGSSALEADALNFTADMLSSVVVLVGLTLVSLFDIRSADAFAAIAVAVYVMKEASGLWKRSFDVLVDAAPEGVADQIRTLIGQMEEVVVERVRVRTRGATISVDIIICMSMKLSQEVETKIVENIEKEMEDRFKGSDTVIHVHYV